MQGLASLAAIAAFAATASAQLTLVVPNGTAAVEGSTWNLFPWGRGGLGLLQQCLYDSSHFIAQGIHAPILITGLKWRPNTNSALFASSYTAGCSVSMSTCPLDQATPSATMANNRGLDFATCYSGVVSWGAQPTQVGPTPFGISIPFTTPFLYDPTLGDLNIECDLPIQTFLGTGPQLDVHGTAATALGSRVYLSAGYPGAGIGTIELNHAVVVEVSYVPAAGLFASFHANVTAGVSPLAVVFTDATFSSAPGGVTSWAWDFDGDSIVDSTLPNPSFTYTSCGDFNVTLTTNDGVHAASTLTKTAYIKTDNLAASFGTQLIGPYTVQFTDTSSPAATGWAWDLDGDSIVDSNAQNPAWAYPNGNAVNVTLTATRNCKSSVASKSVVPLQMLTTNLGANNGLLAGATVYNNLQVLGASGANINAFDIVTTAVSTAFTVDVFLKQGSYVGHELVPASWTRVGQAGGTSSPIANQPSYCALVQPLHIPQGTYGLALRVVGVGPRYITATSLATFANADFSLTTGAAAATYSAPFTATSSVLTPRTWSGRIYYGTHNVTGTAGHGFFGPGCIGSLGVSHQRYVTPPQIGGTLSVNLDNMPFAIGVMVIGTSNAISGLGPLPIDLGLLGAPSCPLRVSLDATDTLVGAGTSATWSFPIPNVPTLSGLTLYNQAAILDPAANAVGFTTGDAAGWVLGN